MEARLVAPLLGMTGSLALLLAAFVDRVEGLQGVVPVTTALIPLAALALGVLLTLRKPPAITFRRDGERRSGCGIVYAVCPSRDASPEQVLRDVMMLKDLAIKRKRRGAVSYALMAYGMKHGGSQLLLVISSSDPSRCLEEDAFLSEVDRTLLSSIELKRVARLDENLLRFLERLSPFLGQPRNVKVADLAHKAVINHGGSEAEPHTCEVCIGTPLNDKLGNPVGLTEGDIWRHVLIAGSTGSGKTTTAAIIVHGVSKFLAGKYTVLVLDWNGEYPQVLRSIDSELGFRVIKPSELPVNPMTYWEEDTLEYIVEIFEQVLELSNPQSYVLLKILSSKKPRSISQLVSELENYVEEGFWAREVKHALLRKLEPLTHGTCRRLFGGSALPPLERGVHVVDLSAITNTRHRCLYALFLLKMLFDKAYFGKGRLNLLVVIDEAHNLLRTHLELMSKLLAESRKYGLSFVLVTQSLAALPDQILTNSNTIIAHMLRAPGDKRALAEMVSLPRNVYEALDKLDVGEAVLISPSRTRPVLVKVDPRLWTRLTS